MSETDNLFPLNPFHPVLSLFQIDKLHLLSLS